MRTLIVETPEGVDLRHELAGPGSRFAAALLDAALFGAAWTVLVFGAWLLSAGDPTGQLRFLLGLAVGGAICLLVLYHVVAGVFWRGQSPGKRVLGLRVVSADGLPAGTLQHVLRGFFLPLEAALILTPVPVALVLMAVTEKAQRLGDLVAGTVVLRESQSRADAEPFPRDRYADLRQRGLELVPALAARVDDEEYELLREVLARRSVESSARRVVFEHAAAHFSEQLGLDFRADPAPRLRELYLYLRERRTRSIV